MDPAIQERMHTMEVWCSFARAADDLTGDWPADDPEHAVNCVGEIRQVMDGLCLASPQIKEVLEKFANMNKWMQGDYAAQQVAVTLEADIATCIKPQQDMLTREFVHIALDPGLPEAELVKLEANIFDYDSVNGACEIARKAKDDVFKKEILFLSGWCAARTKAA
eukprot:4315683-Pyramimonas_sp.AAC.1